MELPPVLPPYGLGTTNAERVRTMDLNGRRILVVEDEFLLADELQHELEDAGAEVIGPAATVASALNMLQATDGLDGALLDMNLGMAGEKVYPVADALAARGVPFVFVTGYDGHTLDERYAHVPRCVKPVDVGAAAQALFGNGGPGR